MYYSLIRLENLEYLNALVWFLYHFIYRWNNFKMIINNLTLSLLISFSLFFIQTINFLYTNKSF